MDGEGPASTSHGPAPDDPDREAALVSIVSAKGQTLSRSASLEDLPRLLQDEQAVVWIDLTDPSEGDNVG